MSKTTIVYYSATGNTLYLGKMFKCDNLISINDILEGKSVIDEDVDRLGILFPVYYAGLPYPIRKFIREYLPSRDNSSLGYIFSIITYGTTAFSSPWILDRELQNIGLNISYVNKVKFPDMYLPLFKVKTKEETEAILQKNKDKIDKILIDTKNEVIRLPRSVPVFSRVSKRVSEKENNPKENKYLHISLDKCISCKTCVRVCPMNNITMEGDKIRMGEKCISCFSCFHSCPKGAIEYKDKKEQYTPLVKISELFKR